jgi:xanthine dehydrogenase/oxidase
MAPSILSSPVNNAEDVQKLQVITAGWNDTMTFWVNGTKIHLEQADPEVTLLEYLRGIGLTGTKLGCAEGGCGACTVVVSQWNATRGKLEYFPSVAGLNVDILLSTLVWRR